MRLYRIISDAYYKDPYSSSGAPARWNPSAARMIYAAGSPSLALLEHLCIMGTGVSSRQWHMIVFDIADESLMGTLDARNLFSGWSGLPHGKGTQDFGKAWLDEREYPFLRVPSARLDIAFYPEEFNVLINPDFPHVKTLLTVAYRKAFSYLLNG